MVTLSKTISVGAGESSGTSANSSESRRNAMRTSLTRSTRCQAIAVRSRDTPATSFGTAMCRR
jgi:hypothetical protein